MSRSDPTLFRSAPEAPPAAPGAAAGTPGTVSETPGEGVATMPPSLRLQANRVPYAAELLEAVPAYRNGTAKESIDALDALVSRYAAHRGLADDEDGYRQALEGAAAELGIGDDRTVYSKAERLVRYLSLQLRLADDLREKEELMAKDPEEMTAAQLKRYLRERHNVAA